MNSRPRKPQPGANDRALSALVIRVGAARALGPVSSLLLTALLARWLGPSGSGLLFVALTLTMAFSVLSKFGLETGLQRFIGRIEAPAANAETGSIHRLAVRWTMTLAMLSGSAMYLLADTLAEVLLGDRHNADILRLLAFAIPPLSLLGINAATLKALGRPAAGSFLEAAVWPLLTLIPFTMLAAQGALTLESAVLAYLFGVTGAVIASRFLVSQSLTTAHRENDAPPGNLIRAGRSLLGVELINFGMVWLPLLALPALASASEAGLYNVAHRLTAQFGILMLVFSAITSPRFAAHYHRQRLGPLRSLAGRTTRQLVAIAVLPAVVILLWPHELLGLFGDGFQAAVLPLQILLAGQLFHLATGPVGHLLAMAGFEKKLRNALLFALGILVVLTLTLVPVLGATGAAIAVTVAQACHKLICSHFTAKHLRMPFLIAFAH